MCLVDDDGEYNKKRNSPGTTHNLGLVPITAQPGQNVRDDLLPALRQPELGEAVLVRDGFVVDST